MENKPSEELAKIRAETWCRSTLNRRKLCCLGLACALHLLNYFLIIVLLLINPLHPFKTLQDLLYLWISLKVWFFAFTSCMLILPVAYTQIELFKLSENRQNFNEEALRGFWIFGNTFAGLVSSVITALYCANISNVDGHFQFLLMFAAALTLLFIQISQFQQKKYLLEFKDDGKQTTLRRFSDVFRPILKDSCHLFALLFASTFICYILRSLVLSPSEGFSRLSLLWSYCSLSLLWSTAIIQFSHVITANSFQFLAKHFLTRRVEFSIPAPQQLASYEPPIPYLTFILNFDKPRLIQYLAYHDLLALSQNSPFRRAAIYAISMPGGHPRNWQAVSYFCAKQLDTFLEELGQRNSALALRWESRKTKTEGTSRPRDRRTLLLPPHLRRVQSPLPDSQVSNELYQQPKSETPKAEILPNVQNFLKMIRNWIRPSQEPLPDPQLAIWAAETLSNFAHYSYSEDKFGVVQRDLAPLFGKLLDVHAALDRYSRLLGTVPEAKKADLLVTVAELKERLQSGIQRMNKTFQAWLEGHPFGGEA